MNCIETERLQLRQWNENGFSAFAAYYADENNAKYEDTIDLLEHGPHCVYRHF